MTSWFVGIANNGMYDMVSGTSAESNVHSIPGNMHLILV